ncbi:MAG: hypothetical protein RL077_2695 [Verrucomicrobiota bacterium]
MRASFVPSLVFALLSFVVTMAAGKITTPLEHFGFAIGDDFQLANYTQTAAYFKKLAAESDRVRLVDIGLTEEGRSQWMLIISSPANLAALSRYKQIAQSLARAENLTASAARALAVEGKAVVWIDGGLHASETVGAHQLIETAWRLASAQDVETERILRDVIVLCAHANPDGQELVSNWYMREPVPAKRVLGTAPRLYQKYIGHDNNRDFYMSAMKETTNLNRQLYLEWFPQIVYNHHQPGSTSNGTIIFIPPFRDPFNYLYDPLLVIGVQALGTAIQGRFLQEGKPGATSRSGANYSAWFNGSLRTTSYFHNMIGLLSEVVGSPTPMQIPLVARRQLPTNDLPAPVAPQAWHYRQSIEYSLSANWAVLDYASRQRETLLFNIYKMGQRSIDQGNRDHWTASPSRLAAVVKLDAADQGAGTVDQPAEAGDTPSSPTRRLAAKYWEVLRQPAWRDPRGFIVSADQADFPTAVKFINTLVKNGIVIHRATAAFNVAGKAYPLGSYVVKCAQAFRPHVLDMFEPQDHPDDLKYEGGPPNRPYDVAGWTLAFQMGVKFDRIMEAFDGPFERLPYGQIQHPPRVKMAAPAGVAGFLVSHRINDTSILTNRLLKSGASAYWLRDIPAEAPEFGRGALYVPDQPAAREIVRVAALSLGLEVLPLAVAPPPESLLKLRPMRIALWDRYSGSMPSGWTRWLFEQFEFPFELIYTQEIDAGNLRERFDALVFVAGSIPAQGVRPPPALRPRNLPAEYTAQIGVITPEKSIPALKEFLSAGGTVVTIGTATNLAYHLALPLQSALLRREADGKLRKISDAEFYIPGGILDAKVAADDPVAWGIPDRTDVYFDQSPTFHLTEKATAAGLKPIVWYDSEKPLRSGWALGQIHLKDGVAVAKASVGSGQLYLMGCEVAFRGQTHGTFKLLFNALYLSTAQAEHAR